MEDGFEESFESYTKFLTAPGRYDENHPYNCSFEDVTQLSNQGGGLGEVFKTSEKQSRDSDGRKKSTKGKFNDISLLLRRIYHWDSTRGETWTVRLEIQSTILRKAFKEIVQGYTSISLEQDPIVIPEPFSDLYFNRDRIQKAIKDATSDELKKELELLEEFRKNYMEKTITGIEVSFTEGQISASDLWSLFPVGSEIILQNREMPELTMIWCVVVKSCYQDLRDRDERPDKPPVWLITAEFTSFDGRQFLKVERSFQIGGYQGTKVIRSLPAYPLSLHPQNEELRRNLIERGKKYVELCVGDSSKTTTAGQGSHRTYSGPFWEIPDEQGGFFRSQNNPVGVSFFKKPTREHEGRLVVDPAGKFLEHSQFQETIAEVFDDDSRRIIWSNDQRNIGPVLGADDVGELTGANLQAEDLLTTTATIAAYSLTFKAWGLVMIDSVRPILWQQGIYDMLQMDKTQKEVVSGIIESHRASSVAFDDFIPGKGRGLVFLLHGPPGCGKTMTAESAAEVLQRPLYYISGAELGLLDTSTISYNKVDSIEAKLERIFKRIARWEAILLFDEADTFVASRGGRDPDGKRNALTSILLRMIEYQSGIIFLTTNRITDFDKALFSRVHITIKYEPLVPNQRLFIWESMTKQTNCDLDGSDFERLSRIPLDGRTIKNILRVASLHVKIRERNTKSSGLKIGIEDIKAVLRFAVGDTEDETAAQKVEEFYNQSKLGIEVDQRGDKNF